MEQTLFFSISFFIILIFSIIIHEISHGLSALKMGDKTAEEAGRLTLNPIPHIDLVGSILLPGLLVLMQTPFLFGWAKPVPYNPNNLNDQKWGEAKVAFAGPAANLFLAIIAIVTLYGLNLFDLLNQTTFTILQMAAFINLFLAFLNLLPVPPLDGSKILFSFLRAPKYLNFKNFMEQYQLIIILVLLFILISTNFLGIFTAWFFNLFF